MTKKQIKQSFIELYYGCDREFKKALKYDYCSVSFNFSCYIDSLNKDGIITNKQYNNITL